MILKQRRKGFSLCKMKKSRLYLMSDYILNRIVLGKGELGNKTKQKGKATKQ